MIQAGGMVWQEVLRGRQLRCCRCGGECTQGGSHSAGGGTNQLVAAQRPITPHLHQSSRAQVVRYLACTKYYNKDSACLPYNNPLYWAVSAACSHWVSIAWENNICSCCKSGQTNLIKITSNAFLWRRQSMLCLIAADLYNEGHSQYSCGH